MNRTIINRSKKLFCVIGLLMVMFTAYCRTAIDERDFLYASELRSQNTTILKLTNVTVLKMDADLTLTKIYGNYNISVTQEGNYTLTVNNTDGTAIDVQSFYCDAHLTVKSLKAEKGIEADYITIAGGTVNLTGDKNVVYAYKAFSVTERCQSLTIRNNKNDYSAVYSEGSISIQSPKVSVTGKKDALRAYNDLSLNDGEMTFISASPDGTAIHSYNGTVKINNCDVTATGGIAIRAEKDIIVTGTLKATSIDLDKTAILSDKGSVYLTGSTIVNGGKRAIECDDRSNSYQMTLSVVGDLTASNKKADSYCIKAGYIKFREGTVIINSTSDAIHIDGTDTMNSLSLDSVKLTATSSESSSTALYIGNEIKFKNSEVKATGGTAIRSLYYLKVDNSSVFAKSHQPGNFAIKSPTPQYASNGKLELTGCSVFTPEKYILDPKNITIYDKNNNPADYVVILPTTFDGTVNINNRNPHPGDTLSYDLGGNLKELKEGGIDITPTWFASYDDGHSWLTVSQTDTYIVQNYDVNAKLFVEIRSDSPGYNYGYCRVSSDTVTVTKRACTKAVVTPELSITDGKIRVDNAQTCQEYLIFNSQQDISRLTEENWENAATYNASNPLYLDGTQNMVNYVYTRVKETDTTLAGTDIASSEIFFGETTYVQGIRLDCRQTLVKVVEPRPTISYRTLYKEGNSYYCKVGDIIQVTASPIPSDATNFSGISANQWYNNTRSGTFYANAACTIELEEGKQYKTVYFVPTEARNYVDIHAQLTLGQNWVTMDNVYLNVAESNGHIHVDHLSDINVNITNGTTAEGIELETYPSKAWVGNLTASLTSGEGTPPVITFNPTDSTMTVNATDATPGTYQFDILEDGKKVGLTEVTVTAPVLENIAVMPADITADAGTSHQLLVQLTPSNMETAISWTSSDESIATVTADGLVTIADDAPIGATATITASSGELSGTCEITVSGEAYMLWVAGTQVTSRNQDDVLGTGTVSFDGVTLTLNNADIYTDEEYTPGIEHYLDYLIVSLSGDCKVESKNSEGLLLGGSTFITGEGSLAIKGGEEAIQVGNDEAIGPFTLTIDNTTMSTEGLYAAIYGAGESGSNAIEINNSTVTAKGQNHSGIWLFSGGITLTDCQIIEPAGATYDNGTVMNGEVEALTVVISPAASHLKGDVNLDGKVDISDVVAVINTMAGDTTFKDTSDVNKDEKTDISDVVSIINIMAGG